MGRSRSSLSRNIAADILKDFNGQALIANDEAKDCKRLAATQNINMLLLGQTGVGKTTFINALRNYLEYSTLEEAIAGGMKVLISSQFTHGDTTILVGEPDPEEASTASDFPGKSSTQSCKSHYFMLENKRFQIIDTPGIGDVRGLMQDAQNTEHILQYLMNVDHLHGICILLKPNESRLTPEFMFCLTSLLTNLHKHAANNIMFCYTNTRATFYSHGDTNGLVKEMLSKIKRDHGVEIPYRKNNTFFFDSECFRLLACIEHGIQFPKKFVRDTFSGSWNNAVDETFRLLQAIRKIKPHVTAETVSLNEARKLITLLSRPMAEIANTITSNITKINYQREKINEASNDEDQLKLCLWRDVEILETTPLDYPRTVCTAKSCISVVNSVVEYSAICHNHCYLKNVPYDTIGHPALAKCTCMNRQTGKCTVENCSCDWRLHQHITYNTRRVQEKMKDESVEKQIEEKTSRKEIVEWTMRQLEKDIGELEDEKRKITTTSARFAVFLKENAITPFNDSIDLYLQYMIEQRRDMGEMVIVKGLEQLRNDYQEEKRLYEDILAASSSNSCSSSATHKLMGPQDVPTVLAELEKLPRSGASLSKQMQLSKRCTLQFKSYRQTSTYTRPKLATDQNVLSKKCQAVHGFMQHLLIRLWKVGSRKLIGHDDSIN